MRAYVWMGREPTFLEVSVKNWHLSSTMKDKKILNRFNYRTSQHLQRATVLLEEPQRGNSISWIDLISSSFSLEHVVGLAPHSTRGTILVLSPPTNVSLATVYSPSPCSLLPFPPCLWLKHLSSSHTPMLSPISPCASYPALQASLSTSTITHLASSYLTPTQLPWALEAREETCPGGGSWRGGESTGKAWEKGEGYPVERTRGQGTGVK